MTARLFDDAADTTNMLNSKSAGRYDKVRHSNTLCFNGYLNKTRFMGFLEMLLNSSR